jgi:chemotaxis protein MotB
MSGKKPGPPIIVKRVKKGHGGHHGGSWKVAYADFVTAMMAFFMVMWIMGMDSHAKNMIEGYFSNPVGFKKGFGGGQNPLSAGNAPQNLDVKRIAMTAREFQRGRFAAVVEEIQQRLARTDALEGLRGNIELVITNDGLRIELLEKGPTDMFFGLASARLQPAAAEALRVIGEELSKVPNQIVIEGHTDAARYGSPGYSNWELSVDRANAARRALVAAGTDGDRVDEVRGYADRRLRRPSDPYAGINRRVSILLPFAEVREVTVPGAPTAVGAGDG